MSEENYDIWLEGVNRVNYPRAVLPIETEVLIIGGGITGISAAYLLAKAGKKPVLLEKRKLGEYVTDCTTGFLSQIIDASPDRLVKLFGIEKSKLVFESHQKAIDDIEKIVLTENIECEFKRCSSYIYANNEKEEKVLLKITDKYKKLGVNAEYKNDGTLKFNKFGYIEIFNQAKFNAIKYITSLAQIAVNNGAIIAENTKVLNLSNNLSAQTGKHSIEVEIENVGIINAKKVFSATYVPFGRPENLEHKYNMYRSYVLEYKIPKETLIEGTYQDMLKPYHYFRIDKKDDFDRLIIGGNDNLEILKVNHELGAKIIKEYIKKTIKINGFEEVRHWSGLISEPVDELACIGESKGGNIFYAFGFSGNGLTYSYIASKIFIDQLTARNNPYSKIYGTDNELPLWKNILF